jgi:hypothetical protein
MVVLCFEGYLSLFLLKKKYKKMHCARITYYVCSTSALPMIWSIVVCFPSKQLRIKASKAITAKFENEDFFPTLVFRDFSVCACENQ